MSHSSKVIEPKERFMGISNLQLAVRSTGDKWCLKAGCVQLLSRVQLFVIPQTTAPQASLSFSISRSLLKLTSIELMMPSHVECSGRQYQTWIVARKLVFWEFLLVDVGNAPATYTETHTHWSCSQNIFRHSPVSQVLKVDSESQDEECEGLPVKQYKPSSRLCEKDPNTSLVGGTLKDLFGHIKFLFASLSIQGLPCNLTESQFQ